MGTDAYNFNIVLINNLSSFHICPEPYDVNLLVAETIDEWRHAKSDDKGKYDIRHCWKKTVFSLLSSVVSVLLRV